jgi:hypothetical protein
VWGAYHDLRGHPAGTLFYPPDCEVRREVQQQFFQGQFMRHENFARGGAEGVVKVSQRVATGDDGAELNQDRLDRR